MIDVALVGCGAVATEYYAPALRELEGRGALCVRSAYDPEPSAAARFCARFASAAAAASLDDVLRHPSDVVVVASPPRHHVDQVVAALQAGADVFCEKPLATSEDAARRMVETARTTGRHLAVGMVRRQFPAAQLIRRVLGSGALGELRSVEVFEGGPFAWPISSPEYFRAGGGNGGVFQDIGAHVLDLLTWWLGTIEEWSYADDAMGGVEANCILEGRIEAAELRVRLSRDWARPQRVRIEGSQGAIAWDPGEATTFELTLDDEPSALVTADSTAVVDFHGAFAVQLAALVCGRWDRLVDASEVVETIGLIERCYEARTTMAMDWLCPVERP